MASGEPVSGAEIFITVEPAGEIAARGKTDGSGRLEVATLKRGQYLVQVFLPPEVVRAYEVVGVRVRGKEHVGAPERAFAVAFTRTQGGPYSQSFSNLDDNVVGVEVIGRQDRPPLAASLAAGRWKHALARKPCEPLAELLVAALSRHFGVAPRARTEARSDWPLACCLHEAVQWALPVCDGEFITTIEITGALADGLPLIKVGAFQAATPEQVELMALALGRSIATSLEELAAAPEGVTFAVRYRPPSGFGVGGFSNV